MAFLGWSSATPSSARIGPVYTPPEHRRRGYAGAATAALSRLLLAEGRHFCTLFADLANPTAGGIYRTIGFRPVRKFDEVTLSQSDSPTAPRLGTA